MALLLVTPRASPATLVLLLLATAGGMAPGMDALRRLSTPVVLLLALGAWAAVSTIWAADRGEAIGKSVLLATLALTAGWSLLAVKQMRPDLLRQACWVALMTFAAALAYLCFEEITGHALKRLMFLLLPFTRPDNKHTAESENDLMVAGYISNRNMAAVTLALWPVLLIARTTLDRSRWLPATGALFALALVTMTLSRHETSIIALLLAVAVLGVCMLWPKLGLCLVAAGWVVATLLVVPLASWASSGAKLHSAAWLPNSARHRIVLWAYTADQVQIRPLIGVGAAATKKIDAQRGAKVDALPGTPYQWRSGPHAHNVYLQTWYELGAIGAALLCAAGLAVVAVLSRLPAVALPFAAAAMTSAAVTAAFSWGMWQAWFLALFAVGAVLTGMAVQAVRQGDSA